MKIANMTSVKSVERVKSVAERECECVNEQS